MPNVMVKVSWSEVSVKKTSFSEGFLAQPHQECTAEEIRANYSKMTLVISILTVPSSFGDFCEATPAFDDRERGQNRDKELWKMTLEPISRQHQQRIFLLSLELKRSIDRAETFSSPSCHLNFRREKMTHPHMYGSLHIRFWITTNKALFEIEFDIEVSELKGFCKFKFWYG